MCYIKFKGILLAPHLAMALMWNMSLNTDLFFDRQPSMQLKEIIWKSHILQAEQNALGCTAGSHGCKLHLVLILQEMEELQNRKEVQINSFVQT